MRHLVVLLTLLWLVGLGCEETKVPPVKEEVARPLPSPPSSPSPTPASPQEPPEKAVSKIDRLILEWIAALDSPDPQIRGFAALSLLRSEHFEAKQALSAALKETSSPQKRMAVMKAYGFDRDDSILDVLAAALADKNEEVAATASWTLGSLRTPSAIEKLCAFLANGDQPLSGRVAVSKTLGQTHSERAVETLIACMDAKDPALRDAAYSSLVEITRNESAGPDRKEWEKWWQRNKFRTREEWLEEQIGSLNAKVKGLHEANVEAKSQLAEKTIKALEQRFDKTTPDPLVDALKNPAPEVRLYALQELAKLDVPVRVSSLIGALSDPDAGVRQTAAAALGTIGNKQAEGPLKRALADKEGPVRAAAAASLGQLGSKESAASLIKLLGDPDVDVAGAAAAALGAIGDKGAVDPLIAVLANGGNRAKVREAAAAALGKLGDTKAVKPLIETLRDPDERVRWFSAIALGQIKAKEAIGPLTEVLAKDGYPNVRLSAATSLGMIGDLQAGAALVMALGDKDQTVSDQAADALLLVAGNDFDALQRVGRLFHDRKDDTRAVAALGKLVATYKNDPARKEPLAAARVVLASALAGLKQWSAAREQYAELCRLSPADPVVRSDLLKCMIQEGEFGLAAETAAAGIKGDPDRAAQWWAQTADLAEKYQKQIGQAALDKLITDLEAGYSDLGGEAIKARLIKLRSPAKPAPAPETGGRK